MLSAAITKLMLHQCRHRVHCVYFYKIFKNIYSHIPPCNVHHSSMYVKCMYMYVCSVMYRDVCTTSHTTYIHIHTMVMVHTYTYYFTHTIYINIYITGCTSYMCTTYTYIHICTHHMYICAHDFMCV